MTAVIAIYSNKGGVGKTATAVNLSYLAAQSGYKTLICDLDPQAATTFYFRVKPQLKKGARSFARSGKPIERSIKGTDYDNLDLLPADFSHRNLDIRFSGRKHANLRLKLALRQLRQEYDLIFLDTPPTINLLAENVFNASDALLVPLIPSTLSLRTQAQLIAFFEQAGYDRRKVYTFFSMVDGRRKMHKEMAAAIYRRFDNVMATPIPYLSLVERMGETREPVPAFAPKSKATQAYQALWEEFRVHLK